MTGAATSSKDASDEVSRHTPDFQTARRRLMAALVTSVTVPLLCAALYGYVTYDRAIHEKQIALDRLAWIAECKLVNLLDLNRELFARVGEAIGSTDEVTLRTQQVQLHDTLSALVTKLPHVAALSVVGRTGQILATSKQMPAPAVSIGDRDDFLATRAAHAPLYVSMPVRGRMAGLDIVNELVARTASDGRFIGAVVVSLDRNYLLDFYRQLLVDNPRLTLGLYRQDGGILVRLPAPKLMNAPTHHVPLANAFARRVSIGSMRGDSPLDGGQSMMAFREASNYPVYVSASYAMSDVIHDWWHDDMLVAGLALVPCVCLWFLVVFSLRRLKAEEAAWLNWRRELAMRQRAEDATRHLQRMGALGNLVASVAHDFNNLLMVVTANMELVRRKNYIGVRNEVNAVERASINARVLARRLMSVARKQPLQQRVLNLNRWLEQAEPLLHSAMSSKITVQINAPDALWMVKVDPVELTSALVNLAVNAKDAMRGGGHFIVTARNTSFSSRRYSVPPGDYVVIESRDTGTGMSDEVAHQAFEPLFTTKAAGAGTGLGLAQVLAMAEQAGGTARLETTWGKGTTVFIYLPRWTGAAPLEADEAEPVSVPLIDNETSVLLVEDNEEVAAGLVAVLDVLGWHARHESDGDAAMGVLKEGNRFTLVLSDIQMPGCDGICLAEWIRKHLPRQAVVLMTGYADHLAEARRLGVTVLAKPFNTDDLRALLTGVPMTYPE
ncbi:ATP-binding protein [Caballeronia sp. HLA56]